jgi:predicted nucleic acid-binding protein
VLSALHQVNQLFILPALSTAVIIPAAVDRELAAGRSSGRNVPDTAFLSWAVIRSPIATLPLPDAAQLGAGESDALWLALESPDSIVVLDDGPARRVAAQLALPFTGTLGLLVDAKKRGVIPAVRAVLDKLEYHGFHMSPGLREVILRAAGESL